MQSPDELRDDCLPASLQSQALHLEVVFADGDPHQSGDPVWFEGAAAPLGGLGRTKCAIYPRLKGKASNTDE